MSNVGVTETKPLNVRLAVELGLSAPTYAPEYFFGPDHYVEPDLQHGYDNELAQLALQAAQGGRLAGTLGLEYAESDIFLNSVNKYREQVTYHGSPYTLDIIEPRQPIWKDIDPASPHQFADGRPAICASPSTVFPAMRAVLHHAHPELAEQSLLLYKAKDRFDRVSWVTSEEVLEVVTNEGTKGNVCPIGLQAPAGQDQAAPTIDQLRNEHRIYGKRRPLARVPVTVEALPPDLCVIPSDAKAELANVGEYNNILAWSKASDIPIRSLGGLWPTAYWGTSS